MSFFDSMRAATGTEQGRALSNSVSAFENLAVPETRLAEQDFYNRILLCFGGANAFSGGVAPTLTWALLLLSEKACLLESEQNKSLPLE